MKNMVTDIELGNIYCARSIFGNVKGLKIEGNSLIKKGKAYVYIKPDGEKIYLGLISGFFKGAVLNYNGRNIQILPPLKGHEVTLAVSGAILLMLFAFFSMHIVAFQIPVLAINPFTAMMNIVGLFLDVELNMAGEILSGILTVAAFISGIVADAAVAMAFISAYVFLARRVKRRLMKILIFFISLAAGAAILCALYWLMYLIILPFYYLMH